MLTYESGPNTKLQSNLYDRKDEVVDKKVGKERMNTDKVILYSLVVDGKIMVISTVWRMKLVVTTKESLLEIFEM